MCIRLPYGYIITSQVHEQKNLTKPATVKVDDDNVFARGFATTITFTIRVLGSFVRSIVWYSDILFEDFKFCGIGRSIGMMIIMVWNWF